MALSLCRRIVPRSALPHTRAFVCTAIHTHQPQQSQAEQNAAALSHLEQRVKDLNHFKQQVPQIELYPPAVTPSISVAQFVEKFGGEKLQSGDKIRDELVVLVGRVAAKRTHGTKLYFLDVEQAGQSVQIMITKAEYNPTQQQPEDKEQQMKNFGFVAVPYAHIDSLIRRGDVVGIRGFVGKTKVGELSVVCTEMCVLAPCLHQLPAKNSLTHPNTRHRHRYLDLLINEDTSRVFIQRTKIIKAIRKFLDDRDFLEVDTAMLASSGGGASARPFLTKSNALDEQLQLRISPELSLKMLVIGGFERVYELGKQFRNESVDTTHNPEFSTCEFYIANASAPLLMQMTQQMLCEIAKQVGDGSGIVPALSPDKPPIDFSKPFAELDFVDTIESALNCKLPDVNDPASAGELLQLFEAHKLRLPSAPHSTSRLLDELASQLIEPHCHQPTFVTNHPLLMSPLAKHNPNKPQCAHRFELFIHGFEVVNAYTELNDPTVQRERFLQQWDQKDEGEKLLGRQADEQFCEALDYGLPPTAGWGLGVDRLVMLLTGKHTIRDVLLFPTLRSIEK